jgi:hypothetical protein
VECSDHALPIICSGCWSNTWETDNSTMRKCKWLFINGHECNSQSSTTMEFVNICQDETQGLMRKVTML